MSFRQIRSLAVAAMWLVAGALLGAPLGWLCIGALLVVLTVAQMPPVELGDEEQALRRQLAVARRRGERVDVVCASAQGVDARDVRGALRISDFATVRQGRDTHVDLRAVVDTQGLDRHAFEARMQESLGGRWAFSWARFPEDGATLDALVREARTRARAGLSTSEKRGK